VLLFVVHPAGPDYPADPPHIRTVAVIPARYGSTRFPGKPLADLAGKPLIEHVYSRAAACRALDSVLVATDDARIASAVRAFGGNVRLTAATHPTGTDRLAEVARTLECDLVVNVQGDEPLIEPAMIEQALAPLAADPSLLMSTLCRRLDHPDEAHDPHVVKVVVDRQGFALYFSRAPIPYLTGPESFSIDGAGRDPRHFLYKHVGLYAYRRDFLMTFACLEPTPLERAEALEQLRALEHGYRIRVVETAHESIGVDTPQDLERVRQLLMAADART
jgi:3-deoxy-manno-octulosonate cytidylyltransferase (CMP-KDO synthetase)